MQIEDLNVSLNSSHTIKLLSEKYSKRLQFTAQFDVKPWAFLYALSGIESSYGFNDIPRYEPAYDRGGMYASAPHLKKALEKYGALAACSYGPW